MRNPIAKSLRSPHLARKVVPDKREKINDRLCYHCGEVPAESSGLCGGCEDEAYEQQMLRNWR